MNFRFWSDEKPLKMIWRIERGGRASHLVGTAHFFPHRFRRSLAALIGEVATVIFEGPLDEASFARIAEYGREGQDTPTFIEALNPEAMTEIDRLLHQRLDRQTGGGWLLSLVPPGSSYVEAFARGVRPWAAFFAIWQICLDWRYSVDLEAYQVAGKLGRHIVFLETIEEQLAVLDSIPLERFVRHLNDVKNWERYRKDYVKAYLDGNLEELMTITTRFVTRGPVVVGARDAVLFERLRPVFEREEALAFIGFPHIPGVVKLFMDEGYVVTQVPP